jgi:predicted NBD/HSP70 family sugar kinase
VALRRSPTSPILDRTQADEAAPTLETILKDAADGDPVALAALRQTGTYLGIGIANLVNLLNPGLVAFGGSLSLAHEYLLPAAREVVEQRAMAELARTTRIVVSSFGQDACVMGGVALVLHDILSRPRLVPYARTSPKPARREPRPESALSVIP